MKETLNTSGSESFVSSIFYYSDAREALGEF